MDSLSFLEGSARKHQILKLENSVETWTSSSVLGFFGQIFYSCIITKTDKKNNNIIIHDNIIATSIIGKGKNVDNIILLVI